MKIVSQIIFLSAVLFFFSHTALAQKSVKVSGTVANADSYTDIYLDNILAEAEAGSSSVSENGKFSITAEIEKSDFFRLRLDEQTYLVLVLKPGDKVVVDMDLENLFEPTIKGSEESELIYSTMSGLEVYDQKVEAYREKVEAQKQEYVKEIISKNKNSLSVVFFIDQLDKEADAGLFSEVVENLSKKYPDNPLVQELQGDMTQLTVGSEAPEIALPNPDGETVKLSSLRGQYVLIDFWASWCGPCIREIPNVKKAYDKYHDKGFEIFGVSLDAEEEAWVNAIEKHELNWVHVSDLKYWQSEVVELYGFEGIPHTVLIDKQGKIIAQNLRGDDLATKLEEIFGE